MFYRFGILSFSVVLFCFTFAQAQIMGVHTGGENHLFDISEIDSINFIDRQLSVEPQALDFGQIRPGEISSLNITITNASQELLTIDRVTFNNESFYIEAQLPLEIINEIPRVIEVFFSPPRNGEFAGNMAIHSDAQENIETIVPLSGIGFDPFWVEETDLNVSILIQEATFNGQPLEPGDLVLAYTQDELLAGVAVVPDGFPEEAIGMVAWGSDPDLDNGFQNGEEIDFRFWITRLNSEVNAEVEMIAGGEPVFIPNGFMVVRLRAGQ